MASNKCLELSDKIGFLYQSITDMQGTIRAIDTKLGIGMVILSLPFTTISGIYNRFFAIPLKCPTPLSQFAAYVAFAIFGLLWAVAFYSAMKGLVGVDNPACHITGYKKSLSGIFYSAGIYKRNFLDNFLNRKRLCSIRSLVAQASALPNTEEQIVEELVFEQMKLAYIRDMKQIRHLWSFHFMFVWLIIGFCLYLFL